MSDELHNRLSVFRAERGMSRRALAESVGVNPQTIGFLERGEYAPSVVLALKIARVFDVPVEAIFALEAFPSLSEQLSRLARETQK
ncbi:helix-turn-helix transcriptional regulator [Thermaurantiacus sp.]